MNGRLHSTAAKIFWILFSCYCLLFFPSFCAKGWSWSWKRLFLWEIHRERQETWGWIALTCNLLGPLSAFVNVSLVGHWDWPLASFLMWTIYCSAKWREHILDDFFGTSFAILVWSHFLMRSSLPRGKQQCHPVSIRVLWKAWLVLGLASRDYAACHHVKIG